MLDGVCDRRFALLVYDLINIRYPLLVICSLEKINRSKTAQSYTMRTRSPTSNLTIWVLWFAFPCFSS